MSHEYYLARFEAKERCIQMYRLTIGEHIRDAREYRKMTQEELAEKLGVARETVRNWERNTRGIKAEQLLEIALTLDVPSDYLLGLTEAYSNDRDIQTASGITGLSDNAIDNLQHIIFDDGYDDRDDIRIASNIISSEHFRFLIRSIGVLAESVQKLNSDTDSPKDAVKTLPEEIKEAKYAMYDATDYFRHVLNDVVSEITNSKTSVDVTIFKAEQAYDDARDKLPDGMKEMVDYGKYQ